MAKQTNNVKTGNLGDALIEAKKEQQAIDFNSIDFSSLPDDVLAQLMAKMNKTANSREEEKYNAFVKTFNEKVQKLISWIDSQNPIIDSEKNARKWPMYIETGMGEKPIQEKIVYVEKPSDDTNTSKVEIKYQNPLIPSETWTGRGVEPKWVKRIMLEKGISREQFQKLPEYHYSKPKTEPKE